MAACVKRGAVRIFASLRLSLVLRKLVDLQSDPDDAPQETLAFRASALRELSSVKSGRKADEPGRAEWFQEHAPLAFPYLDTPYVE